MSTETTAHAALSGRYTATPISGYRRRKSREVMVGSVGVGGDNPIRIQSMTITDTMDTEATVKEAIELFKAGSEIVRITAPSYKDSENLANIKAGIKAAGYDFPICADIHFSPKAALVAVEHVEKVRINPGNYVDQKKFKVREYTDVEYAAELERLDEAFTPLVLRAKELGRALRIGTNHGSLSDRILNRYGDTPAGMVESAVEFIKIAERHSFHDIIISMKASNVQVMVQAYRMLVERMDLEGMDYPLHLGVTEAGDGQDGRIKSAAGIGSLLNDGLGDTIRVSLTEDPVHELPVARDLVNRFTDAALRARSSYWTPGIESAGADHAHDEAYFKILSPYEYRRRDAASVFEAGWLQRSAGPVALALPVDFAALEKKANGGALLAGAVREGGDLFWFQNADPKNATAWIKTHAAELQGAKYVLEITEGDPVPAPGNVDQFDGLALSLVVPEKIDSRTLEDLNAWCTAGKTLFVHLLPGSGKADESQLKSLLQTLCANIPEHLVLSIGESRGDTARRYRMLALLIEEIATDTGRARPALLLREKGADLELGLYDAAYGLGGLLVDGIGDVILNEFETSVALGQNMRLGLDILQAMRLRMSKTEFISCPSCGRTLFDLQETTARIKERTVHLKGVKIAIMGCIVNGPGEMADADFGYVGAGPGKIHLYRGQNLVKPNIPSEDADDELVELIKEHGMWVDPEQVAAGTTAD